MKNELEAIVLDLVGDRVSKIPSPEVKIDLFINVEKRKRIPDSFRNIFLMKAIEALDDMFSKRSSVRIYTCLHYVICNKLYYRPKVLKIFEDGMSYLS